MQPINSILNTENKLLIPLDHIQNGQNEDKKEKQILGKKIKNDGDLILWLSGKDIKEKNQSEKLVPPELYSKVRKKLRNKLIKNAKKCELYFITHFSNKKCIINRCLYCLKNFFDHNELLRFINFEDFVYYLKYIFYLSNEVFSYSLSNFRQNKKEVDILFSNYESKKEENNIKESSSPGNMASKSQNKNVNNNLNSINMNVNSGSFMDNMIKKLSHIQDDNSDINSNLLFNDLSNKKDIIPKGAKKVVNKFLKKYNISNIAYVEDEINNIQANEKAYEVELRNSKLFESKFLDENRFLIDFNYLKNAIQKEKKDNNFEYKKELDTLFNQIEKTIDLIGQNTDNN